MMSRESDRAIGEHLAGFLDDYQAEAERLARPYREAAELRRRVQIAAAFVADMPCECEMDVWTLRRECDKHYLERVLSGDE